MGDSPAQTNRSPGPSGLLRSRAGPAAAGTGLRGSVRQPVRMPVPTLGEQWATGKQQGEVGAHSDPLSRRLACLIVTHEPRYIEGVIEATHTEMAEFARDKQALSFQIRSGASPTYLLADAASAHGVAECIDEARLCAENIILDKTAKAAALFVEPPLQDDFEVQLEHHAESGHTRLRTLASTRTRSPATANTTQGVARLSSYKDSVSRQLATALRKVGRVQDSIDLRILLGRFSLLSYPKSLAPGGRLNAPCGLEQLCSLLQHPRTTSELQTQVGDLDEAMRTLAALKKDDSPFLSEDMSSFSPAAVRPEYVFEAQSRKYRFEAQLRQLTQPGADKHTGWKVSHVQAYDMTQQYSSGVRLDFKTLSLDDTFDWMMETVNETPVESGFENLESQMRAGIITFDHERSPKDEDYPRIRFAPFHVLANSLEKVAIKSVFRFRFNVAPYKLEFTIRREWEHMRAMHANKKRPHTTFNITIYRENWGEMRAGKDQGWGAELENLFHDDGELVAQGLSGQERVKALVEAVEAIRHALTPST